MRKILLLLIVGLVLLSGSVRADLVEGKEISFDRIENWDYILAKLDSQITRADQILSSYQSSREFKAENADFTRKIYMQADELRFLLSVCAPQNVFEITLRCQQIDDLYMIFRRRYDVLKTIRTASVELTTRTETIRSELDRMSSQPQYHRYEARIREVTAKYQAFRDKADKITSTLDGYLDPKLETMMTELVAEAGKARTDTIDNAFFSRQMAAISSTGCIVPISLLAYMIVTSAVSSRIACRRSSGLTIPFSPTGRRVISKPSFSSRSNVWSTA